MLALVFDTETSGLIENPARRLEVQPEIIAFASCFIIPSEDSIYGDYYKEFKPRKPIGADITKITGLTNEQLNKCDYIDSHLEHLINLLENAPVIIGQNVRFDMSMIELECQRYGKSIAWPTAIDLVQHAIHIEGYRLKLGDLYMKLFGRTFADAHRADVDCQMTARCAIEMWKRGML